MNEAIKKDLIETIKTAVNLLKSGDFFKLKKLSNHTIHNASIFQDEHSISLAVIIYSLSKILERGMLKVDRVTSLLAQAEIYLIKNDESSYKAITQSILDFISKTDSKLKLYIGEVIRQAEIKKGSKLYDHGISLGQAASILGISQWELMNYVGKTKIIDQNPETLKVLKRLEFARGLFK